MQPTSFLTPANNPALMGLMLINTPGRTDQNFECAPFKQAGACCRRGTPAEIGPLPGSEIDIGADITLTSAIPSNPSPFLRDFMRGTDKETSTVTAEIGACSTGPISPSLFRLLRDSGVMNRSFEDWANPDTGVVYADEPMPAKVDRAKIPMLPARKRRDGYIELNGLEPSDAEDIINYLEKTGSFSLAREGIKILAVGSDVKFIFPVKLPEFDSVEEAQQYADENRAQLEQWQKLIMAYLAIIRLSISAIPAEPPASNDDIPALNVPEKQRPLLILLKDEE